MAVDTGSVDSLSMETLAPVARKLQDVKLALLLLIYLWASSCIVAMGILIEGSFVFVYFLVPAVVLLSSLAYVEYRWAAMVRRLFSTNCTQGPHEACKAKMDKQLA